MSCWSRSRNGLRPAMILSCASGIANHSARSASGKCCFVPPRGGHSISKRLLRNAAGSKSPCRAKAVTIFPLGWRWVPSGISSPVGWPPVSSRNSRLAAASGSSPSAYSPLGIDQAPRSRLLQNGPPGWIRSTCSSTAVRLNIRMPALFFVMPTLADRAVLLTISISYLIPVKVFHGISAKLGC